MTVGKFCLYGVDAGEGEALLTFKRTVLCPSMREHECLKKQEETKMEDALKWIARDSVKADAPEFTIGDTVRVDVKIREGDRERIQAFEGTVIAKNGSGVSETFTVRRVAYGVGVERVFPLHSPNVAAVKVIRHGKVRRAKLYYLRDRVGKSAKVKERL